MHNRDREGGREGVSSDQNGGGRHHGAEDALSFESRSEFCFNSRSDAKSHICSRAHSIRCIAPTGWCLQDL